MKTLTYASLFLNGFCLAVNIAVLHFGWAAFCAFGIWMNLTMLKLLED